MLICRVDCGLHVVKRRRGAVTSAFYCLCCYSFYCCEINQWLWRLKCSFCSANPAIGWTHFPESFVYRQKSCIRNLISPLNFYNTISILLKILQLKDHLNYGETGAAARTDTWQRRALCTRMACAAELGLGERPTTGRRRRVSG